MKLFGFIPARMASSRFPGKPLVPICGIPMIEHVINRARMFEKWDGLFVTTCDEEIGRFVESIGFTPIMTSDKHIRALDRIAEAVEHCGVDIADSDIIVNVQGDEPMMRPDMFGIATRPFLTDLEVKGTVLAMNIMEEESYRNPDVLKIIHKKNGDILYTSRSPVPHCREFSPEIEAKRIFGIFSFRWHFLKTFTAMEESPLEIAESCDSNRLYDNGYTQRIALYPYFDSFSVDSPSDIQMVEKHMRQDPFFQLYSK